MLLNIIFLVVNIISTSNLSNNPEELGKVNWIRDYDQALERSMNEDKAVFILFQEVPGCSTCKNYGNNVLSHPLIVEAIEDNFIPLVIYNNKGGKDAKVLQKFNEPSWNNPVVRVVNSKGKNIVPRLSGNYSALGITNTIINSMLANNMIAPEYLHLLAEELSLNNGQLKESYVSMYCFWTGEKVIGNIEGVAETEAGFMDGREVVRFKYNPEIVDYNDILSTANKAKCADRVYTNDSSERKHAKKTTGYEAHKTSAYRKDRTPKYYLANTVFQYLPLTKLQAQRINTALGSGKSAEEYLSPRQLTLYEFIGKNKSKRWATLYDQNFEKSWWEIISQVDLKS